MAINLAVHKRTTNEVVRLLEKKPGIEINFIPNSSEGFDCTIKTNNVKIEFVLNTFYPFHPPKNIRVEKEERIDRANDARMYLKNDFKKKIGGGY